MKRIKLFVQRHGKAVLTTALVVGGSAAANAATGSTVTDITDAATSVFATVATICVTIGVFMIGYRLARKIR